MKHTRPPTLYHRSDYPGYEGDRDNDGFGFFHGLIIAIPLSLAMWAAIIWLAVVVFNPTIGG